MFSIDINCDMGEGTGNDAGIMPFISSANIACGYHAGDEKTMKETVELAVRYNVAIGAHPSFDDKENFGRSEMNLPAAVITDIIIKQIDLLNGITMTAGGRLHHVKPHGALYNMSAKNETIAAAIAKAVSGYNSSLVLYGLSGSVSISEAKKAGLKTAGEVFADRTYQNEGSLTSRKVAGALIEDKERMIRQVLQMIKEKTVTAVSGKIISIKADTVCIHGDGKYAVEFAQIVNAALLKEKIEIKTI